ncbi:ornithine--oxo-acid transaminase [Catelliglobosispora koreensis]|uniref:ornithine--oxo-acid transaminase n=1 Tax=Catelliglobosispora koreensis TaxID=129052 RepID=UPI0003686CF6
MNLTPGAVADAERWTAHNYHPLPVVITEAEGAWVTDIDGKRYLDCLAGYSALNFGHRHPQLIAAAHAQLDRLTLTSRAFIHDQFAEFCHRLAQLTGQDLVLPMNTGAEAVETAIKVARKWGYRVKGVPAGKAKIIVMSDNFHGRTTTIVSFSTDPEARDDYGPYTPGFEIVAYGDILALEEAIDDNTVAVLLEPIQGEAGVIVPPSGYLAAVRQVCTDNNILFLADEIQSGLGRTGKTFAVDHEGVQPDMHIMGKALGGGIVPVSAVAASHEVLGVLTPGSHGSTFGGNPLACAVGIEVVKLLEKGEYQQRSAELGQRLLGELEHLDGLTAVRGKGLWAGIDIDPKLMSGRTASLALLERGVLAKDTHGSTIRLAPPIVISEAEIDFAVDALKTVLKSA